MSLLCCSCDLICNTRSLMVVDDLMDGSLVVLLCTAVGRSESKDAVTIIGQPADEIDVTGS